MNSSAPPPRSAFVALMLVTALTYALLYAPQPILSSIQNSYSEYRDSTIALLMTVSLLPLSIAPLVYGFFLSAWDPRRVLLVSILCMVLGGVGLFLSESFAGLLFFRALQGLAIPAALTCVMATISAMFQGVALQRALAVFIGVSIIGGLFGRICAGVVATFFGWREVFVCLNILLLCLLVPLWRLPAQASHAFVRARFRDFAAILRTPGVKRVLYVDALGLFVFAGLTNYLPFHLAGAEAGAGMPEWRIALMYLGYGAGIFVAFGSQRIIAVLGSEVRGIVLGISVYALSLSFFFSANTVLLFMGMTAICLGMFTSHSINPGLINRLVSPDTDKGAVNGLYLSLYYMGGALGSYVPGLIYGLWGWDIFIAVLIGCLLTAGIALWGLQTERIHR